MKLLRSLLLLAGLAALPACASSEGRDTVKPFEPTPTVQAQAAPSAPVSVATPALAAPRSFVVHFDFDSADIRASAMQILYEASQVAGKAKPTAIRIHGFTDASGKDSYNQRLSERRAKAVADQLTTLGVKVATVETKGFGKANPATKTKTKGKSKDNRRVEIVFEGGDVIEAAVETIKTASVTPHAVVPLKAHPISMATIASPTHNFSPPLPLQTAHKHAIKRDRVQIGTAWIPPALAMTGSPSRMGGRAV
ncbi:MAG: OmpA family protein [Rhodospirillaceae bacterium]|nr:OmpA family protein [Rhodospirillales bacterium]